MHTIFVPSGIFFIERQLPKTSCFRVGDCQFVFDPDMPYDYFVTLDNLPEECNCLVDKSHRLLYLGEPPYVKQYNDGFIKQYGHIFSCQKKKIERGQAKRHFPLLPWMLGISLKENSHSTLSDKPFLAYDDFKNMTDDTERLNKCCLITSNKKMTKGHRDRVRFADYVLKNYSDIIDVYGNGYNSIPDKLDVLRKYKYAIVVENCQYQDYWTEKIGDCYLAGCYPIYHGCPNIKDYFPQGSFSKINVCDIEKSVEAIKRIIDNNTFETSKESLQKAKVLVLDEYNIFPQISKAIEEIEKSKNDTSAKRCEPEVLNPMRLSIIDKVKQKIAWELNMVF